MARVGVDIDEVLFPWYALAHEACVEAGITNGQQATSYAPYDNYGCTRDQWLEALTAARRSGMYLGAPIAGSVAALQTLQDANHTVHLVTARGLFTDGDLIRKDTVSWLHQHGIPYDSLTFAPDKSILRVDYFIDDRIEHLSEVYNANDPFEQAFLVDHVTNRVDRDAYWYHRVGHISDAVDWIIKVEAADA